MRLTTSYIDRFIGALVLIAAWFLPMIFTYAFLAPNDISWLLNAVGLTCAGVMYFCAFTLTFTLGGLRYVVTGSEFKD